MAAPSPDFVVKNPPPLNARRPWPFRVYSFPAQWLMAFGGMDRKNAPRVSDQTPPNPHRWED